MIVMIFEFAIEPDHLDEYLQEAAAVRPLAASVEGFVSIERFQSLSDPDRFVSIGLFENETAVAAWRNLPEHRRVQALGRRRLFKDYRLRMAEVTRDYTGLRRAEAPVDSKAAHDGERRDV